LFEEGIYGLLLSLDLNVHLIKLLLEPVQFVEIPDSVNESCPFRVLAKGLAALAGLVVLFAAALVDPVDVHLQLGL
jgi:hypothetical protein